MSAPKHYDPARTPPDSDLQAFLLALRAKAQEAVSAAERNFEHLVEASRSVSTDDEHDPEGVGLAVERAQVSASLTGARAHLGELDRALDRAAAGTYGLCQTCGRPIGAERLQARPAAETCIDCARAGAHD